MENTAGPGEAGARLRALVAELRQGLTKCRVYTISYEHNGETRRGLGMLREDAGKVVANLEAELDALLSAPVVSPPQLETCICAAIRLESGEVFRGHRHDDAIRVAARAEGVLNGDIHNAEQGFITSRHRFVSREEGARLQNAAVIPSAQTGKPVNGLLFSEDLYLRSTKGMPLPAAPVVTQEGE